MLAPASVALLVLLLGSFGFSALLVLAALRYGHARGLLDAPGQRRSHVVATPRGGGVGIVIAVLLGLKLLALFGGIAPTTALAIGLPVLAVAAVGWLDDHRPQSVARRLLVHALASLALVLALLGVPEGFWPIVAVGFALLLAMTAINFSNFMDGVNGMLGLQAMAVSGVLMMLAAAAGQWPLVLLTGLVLGSSAGFLPFNFPQARIFLGDVGSGALGLLLAALCLLGVRDGVLGLAEALILVSALWIDAGLTLAWRMVAGRRWRQAHREHLYQWLVRRRWSHARVSWLYLGWTLLVATPLLLLSRLGILPELAALAAVAGGGGLLWLLARRLLLGQAASLSNGTPR